MHRRGSVKSRRALTRSAHSVHIIYKLLHSTYSRMTDALQHGKLITHALAIGLQFTSLDCRAQSFAVRQPASATNILCPRYIQRLGIVLKLPTSTRSTAPLPGAVHLTNVDASSLDGTTTATIRPSLSSVLRRTSGTHNRASRTHLRSTRTTLSTIHHGFNGGTTRFKT